METWNPFVALARCIGLGIGRRSMRRCNLVRLGLVELESKVVPSGTVTALVNAAPGPVTRMLELTDGRILCQIGGTGNEPSNQWAILAPDAAGNY